jgi:hypothetical protein
MGNRINPLPPPVLGTADFMKAPLVSPPVGSEHLEELSVIGGLDSSVCIATGYGLQDRGSIPGSAKQFFSTTERPERL